MAKIGYCFTCHKDVEYNVTEKKVIVEYRGKSVPYREKEARCPFCHTIIEEDEIWDENIMRLRRAYNQAKNLDDFVDEVNRKTAEEIVKAVKETNR